MQNLRELQKAGIYETYVGVNKRSQLDKPGWKKSSEQRRGVQELFHTREDHALNIIGAFIFLSHLSSQASRE